MPERTADRFYTQRGWIWALPCRPHAQRTTVIIQQHCIQCKVIYTALRPPPETALPHAQRRDIHHRKLKSSAHGGNCIQPRPPRPLVLGGIGARTHARRSQSCTAAPHCITYYIRVHTYRARTLLKSKLRRSHEPRAACAALDRTSTTLGSPQNTVRARRANGCRIFIPERNGCGRWNICI